MLNRKFYYQSADANSLVVVVVVVNDAFLKLFLPQHFGDIDKDAANEIFGM